MQYSCFKAWQVYTKLVVLHILLANYFVYSCELPPRDDCSKGNTPTNKTNIVDLSLTGCNHTHVWISWTWTTPTGCAIEKVVTKGYTCYMENSVPLVYNERTHFWPPESIKMWMLNSYSTPVECIIDGYFEMEDSCEQKLFPVNMTCSNPGFPVQPTSTLSPLITSSSSSSSAIMTAIQTTSILNNLMTTIQPASSIIPEIQAHNPFQTTLLSAIMVTPIVVTALVIGLLISISVVTIIKRRESQNYYDKNQMDFNPNFAPVIPNKAVFKDESLSVKSTIVPLEKWDKPCDDNMIDESAKCYQAQNFEEPDCTNSQDFNPNFAPVIPNEPVFKDETSSVKSIIVLLEKWDKPCDDMMINESAKSYQALKFKIVKENGCSIV